MSDTYPYRKHAFYWAFRKKLIDPYYQWHNVGQWFLVSRNIRCMQIFGVVLQQGGVKRQHFWGFSLATCLETLQRRPTLSAVYRQRRKRMLCCGRETAWCHCKNRFVSNFIAASCGSACDNTAFLYFVAITVTFVFFVLNFILLMFLIEIYIWTYLLAISALRSCGNGLLRVERGRRFEMKCFKVFCEWLLELLQVRLWWMEAIKITIIITINCVYLCVFIVYRAWHWWYFHLFRLPIFFSRWVLW